MTHSARARHDDERAGGAADELARDAAEQHAAHRAVAARAAHQQVDLVLVERGQLVDDVALEQLLSRP